MMANKTFTDLPTVADALVGDIICAVQDDVSVQQTLQQVSNLMLANVILNYAGDPNGNLAGRVYQLCWDTTNLVMYVCTTTGNILTTEWISAGSVSFPVSLAQGGTSKSLIADNGGIVYSDSNSFEILAHTATANQVIMSGASSAPSWSSATYPAATTINQLLYSPSANTISGLTTAASAVLTTISSIPSWATFLTMALGGSGKSLTPSTGGIVWTDADSMEVLSGTATANKALLSGATATPAWSSATYPPSTTINQILYSSATNTITGLATAAAAVLTTVSSVPTWATTLSLTLGGTGASLVASNGGIVYSNASTLAILSGTATANQVLMSGSSTTPAWSTAVYPATTTINQLLYSSSANTVTGLATAASAVLTTVSSVPTWATTLGLTLGGTGASLTASNGGIIYSTSSAMAVLAGTATANQILMSGSSAAPSWSTATYPATATIRGLLYASATNVYSQLSSANSGVLVSNGSGTPSWASGLTNGQIVIGSTGGLPQAASITAGTNISIIPGTNSITINCANAASFTWQTVGSTAISMVVNSGYLSNNVSLVTFTLPTTSIVGDQIFLMGSGPGGWKIAQGASQKVNIGSVFSTTGVTGFVQSANQYDSVHLVCTAINTTWAAVSAPQSAGLTIS